MRMGSLCLLTAQMGSARGCSIHVMMMSQVRCAGRCEGQIGEAAALGSAMCSEASGVQHDHVVLEQHLMCNCASAAAAQLAPDVTQAQASISACPGPSCSCHDAVVDS